MLHHSDFAVLYDSENRLTCHQVPVTPETEALVEEARRLYVRRAEEFGYEGFSYEIDNVFHSRSTYIYITNDQDQIVMSSRFTPRPAGTKIPFEIGLREDGTSYGLTDGLPVVDINTYTYLRGYGKIAMPMLTACWGRCCAASGAEKVYGLFDLKNDRIKRIYTGPDVGIRTSEDFPDPIHFPTFCRREAERLVPVRWQILEWTEEAIQRHDQLARTKYAARPA